MDLNHAVVTGTLDRNPIPKLSDHGTQTWSFTLRCIEAGPAGQAFTLYVPCEAYGQAGETAGDLHAGDAVMLAGKLKLTSWTAQDGSKNTRLCVLARMVKRLAVAEREMVREPKHEPPTPAHAGTAGLCPERRSAATLTPCEWHAKQCASGDPAQPPRRPAAQGLPGLRETSAAPPGVDSR